MYAAVTVVLKTCVSAQCFTPHCTVLARVEVGCITLLPLRPTAPSIVTPAPPFGTASHQTQARPPPPPPPQELVKRRGMECLAAERDKSLMRSLADTMSCVAEKTWDGKDKWLNLLETMQKFIQSNDAHLIEAALILFTTLLDWLAEDPVMTSMQRQMYDVLLQFLTSAPNDDVRVAACKAAVKFIGVRPRLPPTSGRCA